MKVSKRENCDRYYLLKLFGIGIFLHKIHTSEKVDVFHTHPWNGISFIFGSYNEQHIGEPLRKKSYFNFVKAKTPHRVEVGVKPVWTLFIHGPKCNTWAVFDKTNKVLDTEPWNGLNNPERKAY